MTNKYIAKTFIEINASSARVWNALTNPVLIKQYFFGTEAISDWKVGSSLHFKGVWEGKEYLDKGMITEIIPEKIFRYTYLSSFSGLEDKPENYATISYEITSANGITTLFVTQDNIPNEQMQRHSEQNWASVLQGLKKLVEAK